MHYYSVNGQQQKEISISDRALAYGDGLFTTAKITHGEVEFLQQHIFRLVNGCQYLSINLNADLLLTEINQALQNVASGVLKIIITAGSGGRGYSRKGVSESQRVITVHDVPAHYQSWKNEGISLGISTVQLGLNPLLNGLKHLNRIEQVLIRAELDKMSEDDVLVSDINGKVVESSCANIFWFSGEKLVTPDLSMSGVDGIYRQQILALMPDTEIASVSISELTSISSMFICNSIMGIIPVNRFNGKLLPINPVIAFKDKFLSQLKLKE